MEKPPISTLLKLTRAFFLVDAVVWVFFAVLSLFLAISDGNALRWVISLLMAGNAAVLTWFGVKLDPERVQLFTLAILYMALNAVLSITDQFGTADALVLFLSLCVMGLSFVTRSRLDQAARTLPVEE
jgi:phosphoglycerol transferase MdoB-like AlkP superfamily enzyme